MAMSQRELQSVSTRGLQQARRPTPKRAEVYRSVRTGQGRNLGLQQNKAFLVNYKKVGFVLVMRWEYLVNKLVSSDTGVFMSLPLLTAK